MGRAKVLQIDRAAVERGRLALIQPAFHLLAEGRFGRTAVIGLEFVAVENGRIMAGRDHDAASRFSLFDSIRNRWRGQRASGEDGLKTVAGEDLGGAAAELIGKKTAI